VKNVALIFRSTLIDVTDILEAMGQDNESVTARSLSQSTPPLTLAPMPDSHPDTSIVGELLDEIKALKRDLQENAERKFEREMELHRLQAEMDDLRSEVLRLDSQTQMTNSDIDMTTLQSPSTSSGISSSPAGGHIEGADYTPSSHPLEHLLALDFELPTTNLGASSPPVLTKPSPIPEPYNLPSNHRPHTRTTSPCPSPIPNGNIPLPIKSQRKQHMFFPNTLLQS